MSLAWRYQRNCALLQRFFRAGHNADITNNGNHTRKTSGTQGISWYFIVWISNLLLGLKKILEFWLALGKIVARKVCLSNGQVFLCFLITYFQTIVCPLGKCEWKVACPKGNLLVLDDWTALFSSPVLCLDFECKHAWLKSKDGFLGLVTMGSFGK